jgi:hypothetical protein
VYVSMPDRYFVPTIFRHFLRFLAGIPTESPYELEWLLRGIKSEQTSARVYLWRAACKRTKHFHASSIGPER